MILSYDSVLLLKTKNNIDLSKYYSGCPFLRAARDNEICYFKAVIFQIHIGVTKDQPLRSMRIGSLRAEIRFDLVRVRIYCTVHCGQSAMLGGVQTNEK